VKTKAVVTLVGTNEPMDMRLMDYVSVDYEDVPCVRIVRDPTGHMMKYKFPGTNREAYDASSQEAKDLSYLKNGKAIVGSDFLNESGGYDLSK